MKYYAGIDSGSTSTEIVILDEEKNIISYNKTLTGGDIQVAAQKVLTLSLQEIGCNYSDLTFVVGTGYGRKNLAVAHKAVTEITCYAEGANFLDPRVRMVIDIGGQDSKVIRIDGKGTVENFEMNDKCAAGTGRFLEMLANTFNIKLDHLGELSEKAKNEIKISSICAVFAESEMISLFSQGVAKEDIIRAAHRAICERVSGMVNRLGVADTVMFCGGVARNSGIVKQFENNLGVQLVLPDDVDRVGAVGAALVAIKNCFSV